MNDLPELPNGAAIRINRQIAAKLDGTKRSIARRGVVLSAVAALLLGTGATGIAFAATSTGTPTVAYCYQHASTSSKSIEVRVTPMRRTPASSDRFTVAIGNCAGAWLDGAFSPHHRPITGLQAPSLIVCERADHAAASFPDSSDSQISIDKFCTRLGLINPDE